MTDHRILIIGDAYMSVADFEREFAQHGIAADVATLSPTIEISAGTAPISEFYGDPDEVARLAAGYEIVVVHAAGITARTLAALPELRLLACARGGAVNVDLDAARAAGVEVATTPGKNAVAVAELTIGFLISLLRNTAPAIRQMQDRVAEGLPMVDSMFDGAQWFGHELASTRLGLVGYGIVARLVADRARALGATVVAFDPFVDASEMQDVVIAESLDELLMTADVVSLHARATPENRHLINDDTLARLRPGSYLINTARESLVDEASLLRALSSAHLAGAALDVNEPNGPRNELLAQPNVILTPHIGGATNETLQRGASILAKRILQYLHEVPTEENR